MMKPIFLVALAMTTFTVFAAESQEQLHNYSFPDGQTPFDTWNTGGVTSKDKDVAEFAAAFAARSMTIVDHIEETSSDGKRAFVIVADQHCILEIASTANEYKVSNIKCSTKPFGGF